MLMKPIDRPTHSGFTLIELLVVIAIIAVLAGLLFPVIAKVKLRGIETRTTSNLRQVAGAMGAYGADHGNALPGPLSVEQYPSFGLDPKRDSGSLAKLLAKYLVLSERKSEDANQTTGNAVLACPMVNVPDGGKLDDIAGYIMNMELVHDYEQPAWGDVKDETQPLTRAALSSWRDKSVNAVTPDGTGSVVLARKWAMRHTDKKDCEKLKLSGDWVEKLPKEPVFDDHYQTLFFDMHVESYKPVYDEKQLN